MFVEVKFPAKQSTFIAQQQNLFNLLQSFNAIKKLTQTNFLPAKLLHLYVAYDYISKTRFPFPETLKPNYQSGWKKRNAEKIGGMFQSNCGDGNQD
ncbi:hypothetical protein L484_008588 [Morus notabilis]|uniref:Uncharacterized protein n=1 Tax=Morus notabilis TaxID=981085 RepID=W9R5J9_9ROSA|nr:hypothetical protein L484_008588 [Morus notabilis]